MKSNNVCELVDVIVMIVILNVCMEQYCGTNAAPCESEIIFNVPEVSYIEVKEGDDAVILCNFTFNGCRNKRLRTPIPFWRLRNQSLGDDTYLYQSAFPFGIRYNLSARELVITKISIDMNGTSVGCCFESPCNIHGICQNNATLILVTQDNNRTTGNDTVWTPMSTTHDQYSKELVLNADFLSLILAQIVTFLFNLCFFNTHQV